MFQRLSTRFVASGVISSKPMSCKTPLVADQQLRTRESETTVVLDSPAWFAWLEDEQHHSFHFKYPCGEFTARKERKQRGQWYWVAYRQAHCKLYKLYLGKSETLTEVHLCAVAQKLAHNCVSAQPCANADERA